MKGYGVLDKGVIDLGPEQLELYLHKHQWTRGGYLRDVASIWRKAGSDDFEVLVPLSRSLKDFERRVLDLVSTLAAEEKRSSVQVVRDISKIVSNTISVRVVHEDTSGGTIPINDGIELIRHAKEMLSAAALSMRSRRRHFGGHSAKQVSEFVDTLLLGQTEVGSYVVNVIAPIEVQAQASIAQPFAFAVTQNLAGSLLALKAAVDEFGPSSHLSIFDAAVEQGVSANLCDALVGLSGQKQERTFEVQIMPAAGYVDSVADITLSFTAQDVRRIALAAEYFKDNYVLPDQVISGHIKKLVRPAGDDFGTITVSATVSGVDRQVVVDLPNTEYDQAIMAHRQTDVVQCRGDLHITPRSARLLNASDFRVLGTGELLG